MKLDLYRSEVARLASARASLHPGDMHDLASEHADTHLRWAVADDNEADALAEGACP